VYRKLVLDNGLRVVAERMPATRSVTIGVWVNVGSRDERSGEEGVSHFLEHMFFKGTARRSAAQISHEIDALGGEMNAFTTREATAFYVKVVDEHLRPAVSLLADLFHNSKFESKELEKEKQVVLEEIRMVQDDPEDLLQDLHAQHQLKRHPLGRPILGEPCTIQRFRRADLFHFVDRHYVPSRTVVAVAGNLEWKTVVSLLDKSFGRFERSGDDVSPRWPASVGGGVLAKRKPLEQAHLCVGLKGVPIDHKDRYVAYALNTALGGGVSSRLFQEIREQRGLAYSIYSYLSSFSDSGTLTIYAATRPREAARVLELAVRELRRLRAKGLAPKELARAKNQMKGGLMLGLESTQSRMSKLAKDELHQGRHSSLKEMMHQIDAVSGRNVQRLAHDLLDLKSLSVTALGPVSRATLEAGLS
jgi:predicted Zn-dependent peptidase